VENEEQQGLQSQQGEASQQPYSGWQYDQDHPNAMPPQAPAAPQQPTYHPSQQPPLQPQAPAWQQPQMPPQQSIPEMGVGGSLGYTQGMDYHYYDAPQPSQSIPQLRQARLQQLREERLRRQQRRLGPDFTTTLWRKAAKQGQGGRTAHPPSVYPSLRSSSSMPSIPPGPSAPMPPATNTSKSPLILQPVPFTPSRTGGLSVPQAAAEPAQDTSMLHRARISQASMILMGSFIASRILGLLRTSMFAFVFGPTQISDAYVQAFLIPDTIFNIVAGGALSSAFIPVFVRYMVDEKDEKTAWHIASSALNLAIIIMVALALIVIIFANQLVPLYNPGAPPSEINLIVLLTRIMLLQAIVLGGGVIITSVLQAQQNFLLFAIGTVLYNVGLIIGLLPGIYLAFHGRTNDTFAVYAATWGVVLGAILQVGIQVSGLLQIRMPYSFAFDWRHPAVIQIGHQMLPRIFNAAMLSTTTFVDRYLLSFLSVVVTSGIVAGLITEYYQAFTILMLPLGIFGMSISTAAFPTIAEYVVRNRMDRVRSIIMETLRGILFMSIPSSIGLIVLSLPIIQVLLEHGRYDLAGAQNAAVALAFFAVGLSGLASVEILTRAFYALRDSRTPAMISIIQFILKIALSLILINAAVWGVQWGMAGLALSTSIAGLLEGIVLLTLLQQRIGGLQLHNLAFFTGRVLLASLAMGLIVLIARVLLDALLVTTDPNQSLGVPGTIAAIVKLTLEIGIGLFIYIRMARLLRIEELNLGPIKRLLDRLKLSWL
jgi:putative peptidoglycan lipid II flippase